MIAINKTTHVLWDISEVSETGVTGEPSKASMEKGQQMLDILVDIVADAIQEMNPTGWKYERLS